MRRLSELVGTAAHTLRRSHITLVTALVATVGLVACGTESAGTDAGLTSPAGGAEDRPGTAFSKMLDEVAETCPADGPPQAPPSGPANPMPSGAEETPPSGAVVPIAPTAGPEVELNARDWCAGHLHAERVARALRGLKKPTPTDVRAVLKDLGYIDERIHGLRQSGAATRFSLDLRDRGGRLCTAGSAAGARTVVDLCVASATGPFVTGQRSR
ncbi:hypothetical protein BJ965_000556 [Streptomyces luteogriseus]|uniref:Lipoprotein n=1 Tax=Streptomyces luteogriseus TaxID=68233 RepID=A0A7W7GF29_9ACTN|nr:hypothetical protein [Streptomyces luteogriseus]MBB4710674.1 hypothetical protein [Streptomyces luteogriseus]